MRLGDHHRPAAALLATIAVAVGLAACSSSDAGRDSTPAPITTATSATPAATTPVTAPATAVPESTSTPETTAAASTSATAPTASDGADDDVVTDAEVADLEKQLDEIDELLAGVDADLSQD